MLKSRIILCFLALATAFSFSIFMDLPGAHAREVQIEKSNSFLSRIDIASRYFALSPSQARKIGSEMDSKVRQKYKVSTNSSVNSYVNSVGSKLADATSAHAAFKFTVLDEPKTVNAFAIPGGFIYITTGMIKQLNNESELAAVLGHEIGHITENHIHARVRNLHGTKLALSFLGKLVGKNLHEHKIAQLGSYALMQKFSRRHEYSADKAGARLMTRAGYNPQGMVTLQDKLYKMQGKGLNLEFLASHPSSKKRRDLIATYIKENNLNRPGLVLNTSRFRIVK